MYLTATPREACVFRETVIRKKHAKPNYRASFTLPNRLPLKPTVVQFTVGKSSQIGRCARFIPSNLVRCEQFDNDIPVAFRIHL